jgi:hypothetical protein
MGNSSLAPPKRGEGWGEGFVLENIGLLTPPLASLSEKREKNGMWQDAYRPDNWCPPSQFMQRFLIQCANCVLLAIIFLGIPAVTGAQFGGWQITAIPQARRLIFWGLALAVAGNAVAALGPIKSRKERKLCWEWMAVFIGLLLIQYAYLRGHFNFNWLKQTLLWLQKHFP